MADNSAAPPRMIGESASFLEMQEHVSTIATLSKPVLVVGERGTGKELIGARVHFLSARWDRTFLKVNCAAVSESLLEAQLFGHEAGAFTGATARRKGYFERADGGTLFLDELSSMAMPVQEKILRIIEYGEFERLGGNETLRVDVRIVAATNEDLPAMARMGRFREDLLDRLAFDVVTLPPLRARPEDILVLAEHFAVSMVKEIGGEYFAGFSRDVQRQLLAWPWPGNVRELKNVIERAVYRSGDGVVSELDFDPFDSPWRPGLSRHQQPRGEARDAPAAGEPYPEQNPLPDIARMENMDFKKHIQDYEIALLEQALQHCQHNQRRTANFLGLSYHQLRGYLRKYNVGTDDGAGN
ncbi:MAG: phage shock protein operon transcriptional activator [Pseudohongiellaceae bacterium]